MKVLYATDIQGRENYYEEIFEIAKKNKIYLILLGGNLLPNVGRFGELFKNQKRFIVDYLEPRLLEYKNEKKRSKIVFILGNRDFAGTIPLLEELEQGNLIKSINSRREVVGNGYNYIGYSCVPPTSYTNKDFERLDLKDDQYVDRGYPAIISDKKGIQFVGAEKNIKNHQSIEQELSILPSSTKSHKCIYLFHAPPYDTKIDYLFSGVHGGSKAVRRFIEENQPLLTLHGHIHEAPMVYGDYMDKLGNTIIVNPGQYGEKLYYVTFKVEDVEGTIKHSVLD